MQRIRIVVLLTAMQAIGAEGVALDLREAIRLALRPGVQAQVVSAGLESEMAEARVALQRSATALEVNAGVTESVLRFDVRSLGIDLPEASPFVVNVNLQPVVGPFTLLDMRMFAVKPLINRAAARQLEAARDGVAVAAVNERKAQAQVASETAKAYFAALLAQASEEVARGGVEQARFRVEAQEERRAQGLGTGAEVRRAQLDLRASEQKWIAAKAMVRVAVLQLKAWTGLGNGEPLVLRPVEKGPWEVPGAEAAREQALAGRLELEGYRAQLKQLRSSAQAIEAQRLPTLTAFGNAGGLSAAPTPNRTAVASLSYTFTGGVTLRMPVLDGGRRAAQLAEVELKRRAIENAHRGMLKKVELEVEVAREKLRAAQEQLESMEGGMPLAEQEVEQVKELMKAGEATVVELREAESRRAQAQYQRVVAVHEVRMARLALGEATGQVLEMAW